MLPCKPVCGVGMLLILVWTAVAQDQPPRRVPAGGGPGFGARGGPTFGFGPMFGTAIELLRTSPVRDEVRKELAISEEQAKQIEAAFGPVNELRGDFREAQNLAPEDRQKRMQEIFAKGKEESKLAEDKVNQILTPEQRARWKQLWLQFQGTAVLLQPEVARQLGLSDEQQKKMREIAASLNPKPGQPKLEDLSQQERQQFFADLNARRDQAQLDMLAVLNDEQQARFAEMKGKTFPFPPQRLGSFSDQPRGQQPSGIGAGGGLRGGLQTFGSPIELLEGPAVRKELAISDEQMQQLEAAFAPLRELGGDFNDAQNLNPADRQKRFQEIAKKGTAASELVAEKVDQILNTEQRTRLKQLWVRSQGVYALRKPEVANELGLTQEQQDRIGKIVKAVLDYRRKGWNPPPGQPGLQDFSQAEREQWRNELRVLEKKAKAETHAILTDEQQAKLAEMKGKEFDFPFLK